MESEESLSDRVSKLESRLVGLTVLVVQMLAIQKALVGMLREFAEGAIQVPDEEDYTPPSPREGFEVSYS